MPTTIRRIALGALLLVSPLLLGAARFTLVVDGRIASVESEGSLVSAKAIAELAKQAGNGLSFDAGASIIAISKTGSVNTAFKGFRDTTFTFVVDGKIVKVSGKSVGGVPYLEPDDVVTIAKAMGYSTELDKPAGVLAVTKPAASITPAFGLDGTLMKNVGTAASTPGGGGSVCSYMDDMRIEWLATEPTKDEKDTFKNLAKTFQDKRVKKAAGTPQELKLLEDTLKGFNAKVQQRINATKSSTPPADAEAWKSVSMEFLEKVDKVMKISLDLCRIYKLPKDKQEKELEKAKKYVDALPRLNSDVQSIGSRQVDETIRVRDANGCTPP